MVTNTTVTMEVVETEEKRDRRGRKLTPAKRRTELVAAWRHSGLTQAEFARREGVRYPTFATWVQQSRLAEGRTKTAAVKVRFAEVKLPATTGLPGVEVRLPDGTLVRGASAREVAAVVRALRGL
jgi:hypothetical protein